MKSDSKVEGDDRPGLQLAAWSRRRFVKTFVVGTAYSRLAERDWFATVVADCVPSVSSAGILRVRVSDFPVLQSDNGSVRLLFNPINGSQFPTNVAFYPVLINRAAAGQFFALNTRCTHQQCVVPPFSDAAGASVCPCHGSSYAIDGTVISPPATQSLTKFKISFDEIDLLCVEI